MPQELNLDNCVASSGINEKGRADIVFAVRALAVIRVHDSEEAKERNLTIREICDVDPWLKEHSESLMHYLFRAFGRNCIPVLTSTWRAFSPRRTWMITSSSMQGGSPRGLVSTLINCVNSF